MIMAVYGGMLLMTAKLNKLTNYTQAKGKRMGQSYTVRLTFGVRVAIKTYDQQIKVEISRAQTLHYVKMGF